MRRHLFGVRGLALVAGLAFVVRLVPILIGGGLHSYGRYDDGVYYTGAEALTFGRMPYKDFLMLHPPGLLLVLAPFVWIGRLTTDPTGFAVGRVAFMAIGGLNAVLVAMLARRWGWVSAVVAGLLYACWMPAVYGEQSTLLEPLGTTATLCALLLLCRPGQPVVTRRAEIFAGVALGLGMTLKIWYAAPFFVVVAWLLVRRHYAAARRVVVGAVVSATAVLLPFFAFAPDRMLHMVLLDQLERARRDTSLVSRLPLLVGVRPLADGHPLEAHIATGVAIVVLGVAAALCLRDRAARLLVALLAVNLVVVLAVPTFYMHYSELTAAPFALVLGIGLTRLRQLPGRVRLARIVTATVGVAIVVSGLRIVTTPQGLAFPGATFAAAAPAGCVMSDDPTAMIEMNRLTTDFKAGCVVPVDVSGITYDRLHRSGPNGAYLRRAFNPAWQVYLHDYLFSGTSFVVVRRSGDQVRPPYRAMTKLAPVLARGDHLVLHSGLDTGAVEVSGVDAARRSR
ncbi:MAG TPA: glycosyltransferase 87 family protein [Mycobacteriales bacterium]|nr:glycosyltransferase 87 family protein [Mycobacteriales bacterium]